MNFGPPCECTEKRISKNGRPYTLCSCPVPQNRPPTLVYGVAPSVWRRIRKRILARDNHTCTYCGSTAGTMQADHVLAFTRGGTNDDSNLVAACSDCNRRKKDRLLEDWLA